MKRMFLKYYQHWKANIIEENEDGEPTYQVQKLKRYLHTKQCIKN